MLSQSSQTLVFECYFINVVYNNIFAQVKALTMTLEERTFIILNTIVAVASITTFLMTDDTLYVLCGQIFLLKTQTGISRYASKVENGKMKRSYLNVIVYMLFRFF